MEKARFREDTQFIKEQVEEVLQKQTVEMCDTLVQIADMDYVRVLAEGDNELEIFELMVRIHKYERQEGMTHTVLGKVETFEGLMEIYYRILFYLQRIWFELEEVYQKELITYVREWDITPYAVYFILEHSRITDKEQVWKRVTELWEKGYEGK